MAVLRKILEKANPQLEDVDLVPWTSIGGTRELEHEWTYDVDPNLSLSDNIDCLKKEYPLVKWEVPKIAENKPLRSKEVSRDKEGVLIREEVKIKPHTITAKGKTYKHGRIQITLDENSIGAYALVQVYVPDAGHVDTEGMYEARRSHYIYQHDRDWAKLEENRKRNPRIEKEIAEKTRKQQYSEI